MSSYWKNKKVFITGATGFIGSWLTKKLVDYKADVTILLYPDNRESELISSGYQSRISMIKGSLSDENLLDLFFSKNSIDVVFHLGAQTQVLDAYKDPLQTYETNIRGTYLLLEACRRAKKIPECIVVASSDKAYGAHEILPYTEETPLRAKYPYDVSKACSDFIASSYYHTYQLPVVITRSANVYGGGDYNWDRLIPHVISRLYNDESPILRTDGAHLRDYIFVEDLIQGYLMLAEQLKDKQLQGKVFNFGTNKPYSVIEVVRLISRMMRKEKILPLILDNVNAEIKDQYLNADKAKKVLGWKPYFSLEVGLEITTSWYENYLRRQSLCLI